MTDSLLLTLTQARIKKVLELMKQYNADAFLIFNQANYRYLTNFLSLYTSPSPRDGLLYRMPSSA